MTTKSEPELRMKRRRRLQTGSQYGLIAGLVVLGALVGAMFALGGSPDLLSTDAPFFSGGEPGPGMGAGETIYAASCLACHGVEGAGNASAGIPALDSSGEVWMKSAAEVESIILDGGHVMPGQRGLLTEEEIGLLIEYLQSLWTQEQRDSFGSPGPGTPPRGMTAVESAH